MAHSQAEIAKLEAGSRLECLDLPSRSLPVHALFGRLFKLSEDLQANPDECEQGSSSYMMRSMNAQIDSTNHHTFSSP